MLGENTSTILMAAGIGLAALVVLRLGWRRQRSAACTPALDVTQKAESAITSSELTRWQVEMHETARELKAELDSKLAALQTLVAMSRQERTLLEAAIARAQGEAIAPPTSTLAAIERLGDPAALEDPKSLARIAAQLPELPDGVPADLFDEDRASSMIGQLADQGLSANAIASHLRLPIGEVEFALGMRTG